MNSFAFWGLKDWKQISTLHIFKIAAGGRLHQQLPGCSLCFLQRGLGDIGRTGIQSCLPPAQLEWSPDFPGRKVSSKCAGILRHDNVTVLQSGVSWILAGSWICRCFLHSRLETVLVSFLLGDRRFWRSTVWLLAFLWMRSNWKTAGHRVRIKLIYALLLGKWMLIW